MTKINPKSLLDMGNSDRKTPLVLELICMCMYVYVYIYKYHVYIYIYITFGHTHTYVPIIHESRISAWGRLRVNVARIDHGFDRTCLTSKHKDGNYGVSDYRIHMSTIFIY